MFASCSWEEPPSLYWTSSSVSLLAASVLDKERIPAATGQMLRLRLRVHTAAAERLEVE